MVKCEASAKIFVVDECWALCRGISTLLSDVGLSTEARINSVTTCIEKIGKTADPNDALVICGPHLNERQLFDFLRWLHRNAQNARSILISTLAADPDFYLDAAFNHVSACLAHDLECERIAQAVQEVLNGHVLFSAQDFERAFQPIIITPAEQRVLQLMAEDLSYPEIAARLFLSANTVRRHAERILAKLNAHNRVAAVARAYRRGLLS
jgi:DNA-binding NarL/FixJ family response regulator